MPQGDRFCNVCKTVVITCSCEKTSYDPFVSDLLNELLNLKSQVNRVTQKSQSWENRYRKIHVKYLKERAEKHEHLGRKKFLEHVVLYLYDKANDFPRASFRRFWAKFNNEATIYEEEAKKLWDPFKKMWNNKGY